MPLGPREWCGWIFGPAALLATLLFPSPEGLSPAGWLTAGIALLMAIWWITEVVPVPITALLPLVLFPALGVAEIKKVAAPYAHPLVFLFLGGFIIALAMQKWGLHRRIAIALIGRMGTRPSHIIAGFLLAGALTSMWVSNTATALMMLPIATSVIALVPSRDNPAAKAFGTALLLAVAYGATTGGMATLIGTPPNLLLASFVEETYGYKIGFDQWMLIGVPVMLVALPLVYLLLTRIAFRLDKTEVPGMRALLESEKQKLGKFSPGETAVAAIFALTACGWIFRRALFAGLPMVTDTTIAIAGAIALFLIPIDRKRGQFAMDWAATKALPWDVLILFGGGLSLASMIQGNGVSEYLGSLAGGLGGLPVILTVCTIAFGILMLTELTSNTATAATFFPIVGAIAVALGHNPLLFLVPTALAANCSYMMPVGTPPNAIVFGSGLVTLPQMARAGLLLNVALVPVVVGMVWLLGRFVFGIEFGTLPDWAR